MKSTHDCKWLWINVLLSNVSCLLFRWSITTPVESHYLSVSLRPRDPHRCLLKPFPQKPLDWTVWYCFARLSCVITCWTVVSFPTLLPFHNTRCFHGAGSKRHRCNIIRSPHYLPYPLNPQASYITYCQRKTVISLLPNYLVKANIIAVLRATF